MGTIIVLQILLLSALQMPAVQGVLSVYLASALGNFLQTEVTIERVDFGWMNRITLDGVRIADQRHEEMLRAGRISAKMNLLALTRGDVEISTAQLFGARARLYKVHPDSATNFQFFLDAFASKDTTSKKKTAIRVRSLFLRNLNVTYDLRYKTSTPGRFNPSHIHLSNLNANVRLKEFTGDSLNLSIKRMRFVEETSGFRLKELSFAFRGNRRQASLEGFLLKLPNSEITMDDTSLRYDLREGSGDFRTLLEGLETQTALRAHPFDAMDILPLVQLPLKTCRKVDLDVVAACSSGRVDVSELKVNCQNAVKVSANATLLHRNFEKGSLNVQGRLQELLVTPEGFDVLTECIPSADSIIRNIRTRVEQIRLTGTGSWNSQTADALLTLESPNINAQLSAFYAQDGTVSGTLFGKDINVAALAGLDAPLDINRAEVSVEGSVASSKAPQLKGTLLLHNIIYKDYTYKELKGSCSYTPTLSEVSLHVNDPYATLALEASVASLNKGHRMQLTADVQNFYPEMLNLGHKFPRTVFDGHLTADVQGSHPEDATGEIRLTDFRMRNEEEDKKLQEFAVLVQPAPNGRMIDITSDFLLAHAEGDYSYASLPVSFKRILSRELPNLFEAYNGSHKAENRLTFAVSVTQNPWFKALLGVPLDFQSPFTLAGEIDDSRQLISIHANADCLQYNQEVLRDVNVDCRTYADRIDCNVQVEKLMGKQPILFHLDNELRNNMVISNLYWGTDSAETYNGDIRLSAFLFKDYNRSTAAQVSVHESHFCINDSTWCIEPSAISFENERLRVSDFYLHHAGQAVRINGVVAKNSDDIIEARLKDVNLEYVFNLVNFHSVDFSGLASGTATAGDLFSSNPMLQAHLNVRNFRYNDAYMGDLDLKAKFDLDDVSLHLDGDIQDYANASSIQVKGYVNPGTKNNGLDLDIRALNANMGFLNEYIDGVFENIKGRGTGNIRVFGPLKRINLEGNAKTTVEGRIPALNTTYRVEDSNISLIPDSITFQPANLYDKFNNRAQVSGTLLHDALHRMRFHFDVSGDNILGYDTQGDEHELFWGTIFAGGDVHINGEPGEVRIDVKVDTKPNSVLTYNATRPDDLGTGNYITFRDRDELTEDAQTEDRHESLLENLSTNIHINFDVNVHPTGTVKVLMDAKAGDYIALNGSGHLTANFFNKGAFNMYGLYEITDGIYKLSIRDVIRKDFRFREGSSIAFNGNPMQASLDMKATYLVPAASLNDLNAGVTFGQNAVKVNCIMNLTGKVEQPIVNFDFELPNVSSDEEQMVRSLIATEEDRNMQVIYLLGVGRFYTYNANSTQGNQSTAAMNSILSNTLSGQINQTLSNVIGNRNWTFGTNLSTGTDGWNSMDIEGLISGSFLNNRLLFNGNFGYREQTMTNNGNIIGDFDIQWFPFSTDRISLKGYSETNDRYFTKTALTTQGVGVVWKYDFDGWQKLLRLKRTKTTSAPVDTVTDVRVH